VIVAEFVVMNN